MSIVNLRSYRLDRDVTGAQLIGDLAAIPGRLRALLAGRTAAALARSLE